MARSRASEGLFARRARRQKQRSRLGLQVLEDRALMATFNISSTTDSTSSGSLRDAITQAYNNGAGTDTINLAAGTYTLSVTGSAENNNARGDLDVRGSGDTVTIQGAGAGVTIIDANAIDRVFHVHSGVTLILKDLTITDGNAIGISRGGGLRAEGATVTLENVIVTGNTESRGAGISFDNCTATLLNVTVSSNTSTVEAAGVDLINSSVTISGSTISNNTSGAHAAGIFADDGVGSSSLTISNCIITGNDAADHGGGIYARDTALSLTNTTVDNNVAGSGGDGGGIFASQGTISISGGSISQNTAASDAGGIFLQLAADATFSDVSILGNIVTTGDGGGIFLSGSSTSRTLTILRSTIDGNSCNDEGGGIYSGGTRGLAITESTISNNTADDAGGGVFHVGSSTASLTITNSTISGNSVTSGTSTGGGIAAFGSSGTADTFLNVTIVNNSAAGVGAGGLYISNNVTLYAKNSLFANNTASVGPDIKGTLNSQGYNLIESTSGATITGTTTGNITGTDPNLAALGSYGGPTKTHKPNSGSPVIEAGTNTGAPSTDQRGRARPYDSDHNSTATVDIGAVEVRPRRAVNDSPTVAEDSSTLIDVLANDIDPDTDGLSIHSVGSASHGSTAIESGQIRYIPTANYHGSDSFTYTISDGHGSTSTATVSVTVSAVNDAPVNTVPGNQNTSEETPITFTGGTLISIADLDAGSSSVQVTLTATHGTVTLGGTGSLSFTVGDGTADAVMTFTGTITNINTALNGLQFTPATDYLGTASVQIVTNDQGNTGSGGAQSDTDSVSILVNDAPTLAHPIYDLLVVEDARPTRFALAPYFDDVNIPAGDSLTYTVAANDNSTLVTATIVEGRVKLIYASGLTGSAEITIRATDEQAAYVEETFLVTVGSGCCGGEEMMMGEGEGGGEMEMMLLSGVGSGIGFAVASGSGTEVMEDEDCPGCPKPACCSKGNPDPGSNQTSVSSSFGLANGVLSTSIGSGGAASLTNTPPNNPHPVIRANYALPASSPRPNMVEAQIVFGGLTQDSVFYATASLGPSDVIRVTLLVDASTLPTGYYDYTIYFTEHYASTTSTSYIEGRYAIFNRAESEFGNRWWLPELDVLDIQEEGIGWLRGNSTGVWFESDGEGGWERAENNFSTIELVADDWYLVTTQYGERVLFDDCGRMRKRIDSRGNETHYAWWDAKEDGFADQVAFITGPDGRTTSYFYTGGLLTSVADFAGLVTTFEYDNGRLVSVTDPDPDGAGPLAAPVTTFTYTTEGWLESYTNSDDQTTSFTYDFAGRVTGGENADGTTWSLLAEASKGLVAPGSGLGTSTSPAPALRYVNAYAEYTDEQGHDRAVLTDKFGQPRVVEDALLNLFSYTYDSHGRMTSMKLPDPDGAGPLGPLTTTYAYDGLTSNVATITYPDASTESRTYDATFRRPTSHTDPLGRETRWEIDSGTGLVLSETRVVGLLDDELNLETDDIVTSFAYTDGTGGTAALPIGLLLSITDPLGRVTKFAYYTNEEDPRFARLYYRTEAFGTADAGTVFFDYDTRGNVTLFMDELGRETTYQYDMLGRLIAVAYPDPDGAGPLTSPVESYAYSSGGDLISVTDALGNMTGYEYDENHRVLTATLADPDGGGGLTSPVIAYTYTLAGQLETETDPLGRATSYTYDVLNRLATVTLPDPDGAGPLTSPVTTYGYDALGNISAVTDALGNVTTYEYDNRQRLKKITAPDPDGGGPLTSPVTTFTYNAANELLTVTDPLGRVTTYAYDPLGRVETITRPDPDGGGPLTAPVTTFEYDKLGNQTAIIDALGNRTEYAYDHRNRLHEVTQADPDGGGPLTSPVTTYLYDAAGQLLSVTDPLGRVTVYGYDDLGRLVTLTQPDPDGEGDLESPVWTYAYDAVGNLLITTDPLGNETAYAYDSLYRQIQVTQADPDGAGYLTSSVTTYAYDAAGQVVSITDPLGRETTYDYDGLGRLILLTQPDPDGAGAQAAPEWSYEYDAVGNLLAAADPLGNETTYVYDHLYRRSEITQADPDGGGPLTSPVTTYSYDAAGHLLSMTDPLGRETTYDYDNLGRVAKVTAPDPDGVGGDIAPYTTYVYDAVGNVTVVTDALNHDYLYAYDNLYRRTRITDPLGANTYFIFDAVGNLLSLQDPEVNITAWAYDGLDRVTSEVNQLDHTRYFEYDAVGNLLEKTDRNGRVTEYEYDHLHRRIEERWMDGVSVVRTISYEFDAASQLTAASDPSADLAFTYDALGRMTEVSQEIASLAFTIIFTSAYDTAGNRTQLRASVDGIDDFQTDYSYDHLHRMTRIEQQGQVGGNTVAEKRNDLAYLADGRFDTITRLYDLAGTREVVTSTYGYDGTGRINSLVHTFDSTTLAGYEWAWDEANRLSQHTDLVHAAETATYSYDAFGQLTGADRSGGSNDESYDYDDNGNRDTANGDTYAIDPNNQLQSDGTFNYEYDEEGNRILKTEIATGDYVVYDWDYRNRLIAVSFYDDSDVLQKRVEYEYDAFDRRIAKQVDADGDTDFDSAQFFAYDGDHIALVLDDAGSLTNRYLHGPVIDQILADEQIHWDALVLDTVTDKLLWPLGDHLGTIRDLAEYDPAANSGAGQTTVANHRTYDAFGNLTAQTSATDHLFAFTGREWDADASLFHYRARWYEAPTGRFISEDPIGFQGMDRNLTRLGGNSVTNAKDPLGLATVGVANDAAGTVNLFVYGASESVWQAVGSVFGFTPPNVDVIPLGTFNGYNDQLVQLNPTLGGGTIPLSTLQAIASGATSLADLKGPIAKYQYHQKLLDYYRRILAEMKVLGDRIAKEGALGLGEYDANNIDFCEEGEGQKANYYVRIGDAIPSKFPSNWKDIADAITYAHDNYKVISPSEVGFVQWKGWSSTNYGPFPGIALNEENFAGGSVDLALNDLVHEPMHDLNMYGYDWLFHVYITPIMQGFHQYITFLKDAKDCEGRSLWAQLLAKVGPPPKPPTP